MKTKLAIFSPLIFVACVSLIHAEEHAGHDHEAGHTDEVRLTVDAVTRYGIKVEPVSRRVLAETIAAPARVSFDTDGMAHVGSIVKGRAVEIKVCVGDAVKRGDPLVVIESPELGQAQSDWLQKRTAVAVAETTLEPARNAAERARKLYEQNQGMALGEVQKREADAKAAEGAIETAQAAFNAASDTLRLLGTTGAAIEMLGKTGQIDPKHIVTAPIGGQVIEREITLGELVGPDRDSMLMLADVSKLWVIADVPESQLRHVCAGSAATVEIAAASDEAIRGTVSHIAPALDSSTRTAAVRIEVQNPDGQLRPGMFATARIVSAEASSGAAVLVVPEEAVQTVEGGPAVFVPVEGEARTYAERAVTVGPAVEGLRAVTSGLKEGESIVASGSFILKAELGKSEASHEH